MSENVKTAQRFMAYRLANDRASCMALVCSNVKLLICLETPTLQQGLTIISGQVAVRSYMEKIPLSGTWEAACLDKTQLKVIALGRMISDDSLKDVIITFEFNERGKIQKMVLAHRPLLLPNLTFRRTSFSTVTEFSKKAKDLGYRHSFSKAISSIALGARNSVGIGSYDCKCSADPAIAACTLRCMGNKKIHQGDVTSTTADEETAELEETALNKVKVFTEYGLTDISNSPGVEEAEVLHVNTAQMYMAYRLSNNKNGCMSLISNDFEMEEARGGVKIKGRDSLRQFLNKSPIKGTWDGARFDRNLGKVVMPGTMKVGYKCLGVDSVFDFDSNGKIQHIRSTCVLGARNWGSFLE